MIKPVLTFLKLIPTKLRAIFQFEFERIHPPINSTCILALILYKARYPQQFSCARRLTIHFKVCFLLHSGNRNTWIFGNKYVCVCIRLLATLRIQQHWFTHLVYRIQSKVAPSCFEQWLISYEILATGMTQCLTVGPINCCDSPSWKIRWWNVARGQKERRYSWNSSRYSHCSSEILEILDKI